MIWARTLLRTVYFSFRDGFFACSFLQVLIDQAHADGLSNLSPIQIEALDYLEEVANEPDQSIRLTQSRNILLDHPASPKCRGTMEI